jgi:serine/threonine protein kinase
VALGTVGYMSPEQVRGQVADHRSDIFSFGVILYEMLSGRRAFLRETMAETMTAILKEEPEEVTEINSKVPPQVGRIVQRCMEKKPERRFQSASDLCFALETLSTRSGSQFSASAPVTVRGRNRERLVWIVITGLISLVAVAATIAYFRRPQVDVAAMRFVIPAAEKGAFLDPSISPDGRSLVYRTSAEGKPQLWIRHLDSLAPQPLPGTDKTDSWLFPFWSPDGRQIAFFYEGKLRKMETSGGPAQSIAEAPTPRGGSWNKDGAIVFTPDASTPLYRVSATGGEPTQVTTLDESRQETSHRWPFFLPDGRHFLYLAQRRF